MKRKIIPLVLLAMSTVGCSFPTKVPMEVLTYTAATRQEDRNLFVFMRGLGGSHVSFEKEGLVDEVRRRELPYDMVAPNAHFGYYSKRTLTIRLREDVILPARQKGYQKIWLVGVSMGGLGSLLYLREHPRDIDGVYLIAPFLGYDSDLKEILSAGGVRQWHPPEYDSEDDWQAMLWNWIKTEVATGRTPPIYLGYGNEDKYISGQQLLADVLPPDHVNEIQGGHTFSAFRNLWNIFLENKDF